MEVAPPDIAGAGDREFTERVLAFCRQLRDARLNVTPGRIIDVFRSLRSVNIAVREEVRLAMRVNLVSSHEEESMFDQLFALFWEGKTPPTTVATQIELEPRPDDQNEEHPDTPPEFVGSPRQYSPDHVVRDKAVLTANAQGWEGMQKLLHDLMLRLATRPSRRLRPSRRGQGIDLRRSLRKNMRYGMDVVELMRSERKIRKTRVVMLCDVSGSMDTYNPFLLQLMFGLQKGLKNSRTAVFSTRMTEITRPLRRQEVHEALREVADEARHWSGGTDIGGALAQLNRKVLREGPASSTVCVIISDGYDHGDASVVKREMQALHRHARTVVWINPLLGTEGYAPLAQGMQAALPYVDHFLPAHDLPSLKALCRTLGEA
ncbi:MAG: VWA domain-containing protein [Candidatus Binatia bacterium]